MNQVDLHAAVRPSSAEKSELLNSEVNFYNFGRNCRRDSPENQCERPFGKNASEAYPTHWKKEGYLTLHPSANRGGKVYEAVN